MTFDLHIYAEDKKAIAKTYSVESFDLSFGVIRNIMKVLKPDELDITDKKKVGFALLGAWDQVEPLLMDMFPGVTSEELANAHMSNIIDNFKKAFAYLAKEINAFGDESEKN